MFDLSVENILPCITGRQSCGRCAGFCLKAVGAPLRPKVEGGVVGVVHDHWEVLLSRGVRRQVK